MWAKEAPGDVVRTAWLLPSSWQLAALDDEACPNTRPPSKTRRFAFWAEATDSARSVQFGLVGRGSAAKRFSAPSGGVTTATMTLVLSHRNAHRQAERRADRRRPG